jgi:hypothetical protein
MDAITDAMTSARADFIGSTATLFDRVSHGNDTRISAADPESTRVAWRECADPWQRAVVMHQSDARTVGRRTNPPIGSGRVSYERILLRRINSASIGTGGTAMTNDTTPKRKMVKPKRSAGKAMVTPAVSAGTPLAESADGATRAPLDRRMMIEREAYLRAERRGFEPGHELEDWLAAEHSLGASADT